jgi:hypothetical protein
MLISIMVVLLNKPQLFAFWKKNYTKEQAFWTLGISVLLYFAFEF